jgi:aspartate-semialdehyde dehydrogenase
MLATKDDVQTVPLKQMPLVKTGGYIDGAWYHTNTTFNITDPATGDVITEVYAMDASVAADAVTAAQDANLDCTVSEAISAKFATNSQDCLGANQIFIARDIYDEFCKRFTHAAGQLTVGAGKDDPYVGPLIHDHLVQKQESQVADALSKGARLALGGKRHPAGSLFFEHTVLVDVPAKTNIMRDETFGPIAAVTPFDTEEEVIARANDTEYGLVAYVHTQDPKRIYRMSKALEFGMVAINRTSVTGPPIPFGGVKQSGLGCEGARHGLEEFTEIKYVCRDWS